MTIVVNFLGGPGVGKSTLSYGVMYYLKKFGYSCEFTGEYAKGLVYEGRKLTFKNQPYIFGKQYQLLFRSLGQVDILVTDSPLILSSIYSQDEDEDFNKYVLKIFNTMNNLTFLVERGNIPYESKARNQTKEEAIQIDTQIKQYMIKNNVNFFSVDSDEDDHILFEYIIDKINEGREQR